MNDDQSLLILFEKLTRFIDNNNQKIIFSWQNEGIHWQKSVSFIINLLQWLENKSCQLLLISKTFNGQVSLLHGAALSLQHEAKDFTYRCLITDSVFYQKPQTYFDTCFKYGFRKYELQDGRFLYENWEPVQLQTNLPSVFTGNIIIAGGTGAIGHALARFLTQIPRCQVFITGRQPLTDTLATSLKNTGTKAYFHADISDFPAMHETCEYIEKNHGPINSIFHLAGTLNDRLLINKTPDIFLKTLNPKVGGALVIEKLVNHFAIPRVILFSSLSGVIGNIGQSDYSSANSFLNAMAEKNNVMQSTTKWHAINWGLWETAHGMQMETTNQLKAMPSISALNTLIHLITNNVTISTVYNGAPELVAEIPPRPRSSHAETPTKAIRATVNTVQTWVKAIITQFTKFPHLELSDSLLEMGVDSIIATHIATHIQQALSLVDSSVHIAKTLLFQYGTIEAIANHLIERYPGIINSIVIPTNNAELEKTEPTFQTLNIPLPFIEDKPEDNVAIIGMAGEFPSADNIKEFWDLLKNSRSAIEPIPITRWDWKKQSNISDNQSDARHCRQGGFIRHAKLFDEKHFNIAPIDAEKMDPQARRLLHQTYFALEDCDFLKKSHHDVGVFCAAMYNHYQNLNSEKRLIDSSFSALANHLSYAFDFKGPSLCVDSMCSGGLTALHLALNSLRLGDCKAAVVGGVNIMSHPGKYRFLSDAKFLSPTGKCHSFGIAADGYVPGEGVVVLVLKPLTSAMNDNDKIYGIIRGSSINAIGRGSAFTVPSAIAQTNVIRKTLEKSGLNADHISYIETHGTGTQLGDPIEVEGLNAALRDHTSSIAIGSLKSNIGHLESAAGLASIVKVLLQMHYRTLVPTLNCEIENPLLEFNNGPLVLQKKLTSWGNDSEALYAGVSSFGAGGANAHVILESPPKTHQRSSITTSNHQFNQKTFWADLGAIKPVVQTPKLKEPKAILDVVLIKPELVACREPFSPKHNQVTIYLCTHAQQPSIANQVEGTHNHYCVLESESSIGSLLSHAIRDQIILLVNLTALDSEQLIKDYSQQQFELVKYLSQSPHAIDYLHCLSLTTSDEIKAYSALYRTLALEKANFSMAVIETDQILATVLSLLNANTIRCEQNYIYYTYLRQQWFEKQLHEDRIFLNELPAPLLKSDGVYLIIGGLGAVGVLIAKYLITTYQANVILVGRSPLTGAKKEQFQKLYQLNQSVEYQQVDITQYDQLSTCIEMIIQKYSRLNGVIHSACVLNDSLINEKTFNEFNSVIESKIIGTRHLDKATAHLSLDCFILFSSMSSVFGNVGQADYCVGNAFLDLLASTRNQHVAEHKRFGKTISINWPIWQVEGLAIDQSTVDFICETTGIVPLQKDHGTQLFERLIDQNVPTQIIPLSGNNDLIRQKLIYSKSTTQSIVAHDQTNIIDILKQIIASVTKAEPSSLHKDTGINELGFTSVLLGELADKIEKALNISIAPSAFFTYNTLDKIANYLNSKLTPLKQDMLIPSLPTNEITFTAMENEYAIIGMDGLLPGGPDLDGFWHSLLTNKSAIKKVERWDAGEYFAATLPDIAGFDNQFFGLSNREAMLMDPQHRLFLQVAYNTLLNGGYPPSRLKNVGVFVGVQFNDYQNLLQQNQQSKHPYAATGNSHAMLANRVSYLFDYNGPSQTIDTACSSTLVAINRGLLALKNGDCDAVLAGAVSLLIDPNVTESASSMGILSPRYRCASFDEEADGYVRGEGVGCFLIKRLGDAVRDKDAIHAVIKGFSENHGGRANSLTAPNPLAQKALLLKAYDHPLAQKVTYIETHGTGTKLGDPIEIDALNQAFSELHPKAEAGSILLGAVKSNIGHLEPAAGVGSLVKVIYALKHHIIPANIHFNTLNPYVQLNDGPFALVQKNKIWNSQAPRVAGISSFGFGGSNAHMVLMEPPRQILSKTSDNKSYPFTLSAKSKKSLDEIRLSLATFLQKQDSTLSLGELSYSLNCCREHFKYRLGFIASDIRTLISHLLGQHVNSEIEDKRLNAHLHGETVDWHSIYPLEGCNKIHLPGYSFNNKAFWFDKVAEEETDHAI